MKLRNYQNEAIEFALKHDGFALLLEQRTGKTPIAVEIAKHRRPQRLLVVTPKIGLKMWTDAFAGVLPDAEVIIMTWRSMYSRYKKLRKWNPDGIIADESQDAKNRSTKQSRALRLITRKDRLGELPRPGSWRLILTGTLMDTGCEDAWAQIDFLDPTIFGTWSDFQSRYLTYGGYMGRKIVGYRNQKEFRAKLHTISYRVLLDDVKKEKTVTRNVRIRFDLEKQGSLKYYQDMEKKYAVQLANGTRIIASIAVAQIMKLHQISGGFIHDDEKKPHQVGDEKMATFRELVERLEPPFVVFVRFLWELDRVAKYLSHLGYSILRIQGGSVFRGFKEDVAVVQIQSGILIDLAKTNEGTVVFYSFNYSHLDHEQAKFRVRSYTTNRVTYYYLIGNNTVDEDLYAIVQGKRGLTASLLNRYEKITGDDHGKT